MALINNSLYKESHQEQDDDADADQEVEFNDPARCEKHPQCKQNTYRYCFKHKTTCICSKCSKPAERKKREEKGPKRGGKHTTAGHVHFYQHGGCYARHKCGHVNKRRSKEEMVAAKARGK
jgi:hypothetical protein